MTKLFIDTEFTGLHAKTTLISIGIVADTGETFYAELTDYDTSQIDGWLDENVVKNLNIEWDDYSNNEYRIKSDKRTVRTHLSSWLRQFGKCLVISDCLSYDWVLFCDIFGHAFSVPDIIYYIPMDICTIFLMKNIDPDINRETYAGIDSGIQKHNALYDAIVIKKCYEKLTKDDDMDYRCIL